jgi:hypothetical protein
MLALQTSERADASSPGGTGAKDAISASMNCGMLSTSSTAGISLDVTS